MALPSSSRPTSLGIALVEQEEERKKSSSSLSSSQSSSKLKLVVTPIQLFLRSMADWYIDLKRSKKLSLTPTQFKIRALNEIVAIGKSKVVVTGGGGKTMMLNYDQLPLDWIKQLREMIKRRYEEREIEVEDRVEFKLFVRRKRKIPLNPKSVTAGSGVGGSGGGGAAKPGSSSSTTAPKRKKFVDCTKDPPPPQWIAAYVNGVVLPRVLSFHSTEDANILYYNYKPKLVDDAGNPVILPPRQRVDFRDILPDP